MPETITRPSAEVAIRALRDRLVVVAGAVEQLPEGPMREALTVARDTYANVIVNLSVASVAENAHVVHVALHLAIEVGGSSAPLADVLEVLGGGHA